MDIQSITEKDLRFNREFTDPNNFKQTLAGWLDSEDNKPSIRFGLTLAKCQDRKGYSLELFTFVDGSESVEKQTLHRPRKPGKKQVKSELLTFLQNTYA